MNPTTLDVERLAEAFGPQAWLAHLDMVQLMWAESPQVAYLYPGGWRAATAHPFAEFPRVAVVQGDLEAQEDLVFSTEDHEVCLTVVRGNLRARNLVFRNSAMVVVQGDVDVSGFVCGTDGDMAASLEVGGRLRARAVLLDSVTTLSAGAVDAVVCAAASSRLRRDISHEDKGAHSALFAPEAFFQGTLSIHAVATLVRSGQSPFLPGRLEALARENMSRP